MSKDQGEIRTATTDSQGSFVFPNLRIGPYSLRVDAKGFAPAEVQELLVSVGQAATQDIRLTIANSAQQLEVVEQATALQTSANTQSFVVGYERMEHAPSPGRNYLNFVLTAPGVTPSSGSTTGRSPAGTWNLLNDSGFTFSGIRGRNNSVSIDGVDNRDETTGSTRVSVPLEMIQELRVVGTTVSADFGGAAGGMVNIVTRSGTNQWHGHGEFEMGHEILNARNPEFGIPGRPKLRRWQPGGSASGPLRQNRTFLAAAAEWFYEDCDEWSETDPSLIAGLAGSRYQQLREEMASGLFTAGERNQQYSAKVQHAVNSANSFTARIAYSKGSVNRGVQGIENFSDVTARASSRQRDWSAVFGMLSVLSPSKINNLNVQVATRGVDVVPNIRGPQYEIPGVLTFGQGFRSNQNRDESHFQIMDGLSLATGGHLISLGVDIHRVGLDSRIANRFGGIFIFPTLIALGRGEPDVYLQAFGRAGTQFTTTPVGLWINDRWQVKRGLTVDIGLRYDRQWMPARIPASNLNFAPRLGVAWNPRGGSKWVLRFGAGLFFDRYPLAFLNESIQKDGFSAFENYAVGADARRVFQASATSPLQSPLPFLTPLAYSASHYFPSVYAARITGGFERLLDSNTTLAVEYSFARALHLPRIRNTAGVLPPDYGLEQTARSTYHGATASINRRFSNEFAFLVSYSIGRAMDDGSDYEEQPLNPLDISLDWGRSRQDQAHRITGTLFVELPLEGLGKFGEHVHFVPTFTFGTGRPLNTLLPTDAFRTGAYPISARPPGTGRNTAVGPAVSSLDFRLFKEIRFEARRAKWQLGVETFNLLNHSNAVRLNQFAATPGAARGVIEFSAARQIQLFTHVEF